MKLVRYGAPGREKPGIIGDDGKIRDLSRIVKDIDGAMLASGGLAKIKKAARKLFVERGYHATRPQDISKQSLQSLSRHAHFIDFA